MRHRIPALGVLGVSLVVVPLALGQALGPADFAVNIPTGPAVGGPPADFNPTANCTPPLPSASSGPAGIPAAFPAVYQCSGTYLWSASGTEMNGSVTRISDGQQGTLTGKCDWNMTNDMQIDVTFASLATMSSPTSTVSRFGGQGGQACAWNIAFGDGTLVGTMSGTSVLDQPNPTTGRFTGNLNIVIVGGTGIYALANGTGAMVQQQEFPLTQPPAPSVGGVPSSGVPGSPFARGARAMQAGGSSMNMRLTKGKPKVTFLVPNGKITTATNYNLHLAAAPKSACKIVATRGKTKKTINLKDPGGKGDLLDSKTVGKRLGTTGTWKMKADCSVKVAGKKRTFSASKNLTLAKVA